MCSQQISGNGRPRFQPRNQTFQPRSRPQLRGRQFQAPRQTTLKKKEKKSLIYEFRLSNRFHFKKQAFTAKRCICSLGNPLKLFVTIIY
jgi:hypothetical protein